LFYALCLVSLCDATRLDAQVYLSQVLPLAVTVVNNISMYFENYSGISYVSWKANLGSIVREVKNYQVECVSQNYSVVDPWHLVWIRIRIRGSMPLTNESGSCYLYH
jgi:hypothetical protein